MSGLPSSSSTGARGCSVCNTDLSEATVIAEKLRGGMFTHVRVKECPGCKLVQLSPKPYELSCNTSQNDLVDPATSIYNVKKAELIPSKVSPPERAAANSCTDQALMLPLSRTTTCSGITTTASGGWATCLKCSLGRRPHCSMWDVDMVGARTWSCTSPMPEVEDQQVPLLLGLKRWDTVRWGLTDVPSGCSRRRCCGALCAVWFSSCWQEWFPECRFQAGFLDEPWAVHHEERYDVVVMFSMLACTRDPVSTLQGALQLVKPGGHLILDDKNVANDMLQHVPEYHQFHWSSEENFYFDQASLIMVCKKAGLQQELQVRGVQRYGLSNLISWVDFGRPQIKRPELVTDHPMLKELEAVYRAKREESCSSDHMMFCVQV